jgi:hypothetical protein
MNTITNPERARLPKDLEKMVLDYISPLPYIYEFSTITSCYKIFDDDVSFLDFFFVILTKPKLVRC